MKIKTLLGGIIPTLIFNFKAFGIINTLKMKFPVFVGGGVTIGKVSRDTISFGASVVTGMVHIGMGGVSDMPYNHGYIRIDDGARVVFSGRTTIGKGCDLLVGKNSEVTFGQNFSAGNNFYISSNTGVIFGDDVLLGWNVSIRDSDGHKVIENGIEKLNQKKIVIGDHVWIGSDATIFKGVEIKKDSVVASHAIVTKIFKENGALIGGFPAAIIKKNINWKY